MEARKFLETMALAEKLKNSTRHSWTSNGRHESVAEHSWRLALMAFFLRDEFPEADMDKVIRMGLVHDLGEIFTGDIPAFEKTKAHEETEERLLTGWVETLPAPYDSELAALYREMEARETLEARIFKALDKLEAVIQHNEASVDTWLPLERELNLTYGADAVAFSPYLTALRGEIRKDTEEKLEECR